MVAPSLQTFSLGKVREEVQITVLDTQEKHVYQPGFLYVAFGNEKPGHLIKDERKLLNKRVKFIVRLMKLQKLILQKTVCIQSQVKF